MKLSSRGNLGQKHQHEVLGAGREMKDYQLNSQIV